MTTTQTRDDLSYRPGRMMLSNNQRRKVTPDLQRLMRGRETLRRAFMVLQVACDKAEADDAIGVEAFADLDEHRDRALSDLNEANDAMIMFEPRNIADMSVVVAIARHQIATSEVPEKFLEHILSVIERLVLEAAHE